MGINLDFTDNNTTLDHVKLPMQQLSHFMNQKLFKSIHKEVVEPSSMASLTKCAAEILDEKYEAADLPKVKTENCSCVLTSQ